VLTILSPLAGESQREGKVQVQKANVQSVV